MKNHQAHKMPDKMHKVFQKPEKHLLVTPEGMSAASLLALRSQRSTRNCA